MRVLILYAHPNPTSFCHAILESLGEVCCKASMRFEVRDLYDMNFDPILRGSELKGGKNRNLSKSIRQEQDLIREADWIFMVFPLWWSGLPAILKGYLDRVLTYGFAFSDAPDGMTGLLQGKKALLFTTTGTSAKELQHQGIPQALQTIFTKGLFEFCGIEMVGHLLFHAVPSANSIERKKMLENMHSKVGQYLSKQPTCEPSASDLSTPLTFAVS